MSIILRILLLLTVVSGVITAPGGFLVYKTYESLSLTQTRLQAVTQELLEINYIFEKENFRLKDVLAVQERLSREQTKLINIQKQLSVEQQKSLQEKTTQLGGLETELSGAKLQIEDLKKVGGEPLPKDFINSLLQATIRVKCLVGISGSSQNFKAGSGSLLGRFSAVDNKIVIMTNAHVAIANQDTGQYNCRVVFGENTTYEASVVRRVVGEGLDFAFLTLGDPIHEESTVTPVSYSDLNIGFCEFRDVGVGDRITILSFPKFTGPSNAVSDGYVTNILDGPVYEASAIIDQGSSGGVALLNKERCVLGMPTWKGVGSKLGLSYIQSWPMMLSYR